uniref:Uncharacterized protein n=1 Tax=Salix viminalis TaxID=40686 RepID=A0A6N2K530_SALVM
MGNQRQNIILGVRPGWATTEESFEPHNRTVRRKEICARQGIQCVVCLTCFRLKEPEDIYLLCRKMDKRCRRASLSSPAQWVQDVIFEFLAAGISKGLVDHVPAEKLLDPDEGDVQTWIGYEFVPSTIRPRLVKLS